MQEPKKSNKRRDTYSSSASAGSSGVAAAAKRDLLGLETFVVSWLMKADTSDFGDESSPLPTPPLTKSKLDRKGSPFGSIKVKRPFLSSGAAFWAPLLGDSGGSGISTGIESSRPLSMRRAASAMLVPVVSPSTPKALQSNDSSIGDEAAS